MVAENCVGVAKKKSKTHVLALLVCNPSCALPKSVLVFLPFFLSLGVFVVVSLRFSTNKKR